ncbi:MAG: glucose 1-dehydrogenase [Pseudomonadota bacterium]|nr:glucose 1-dehydrogenase [Pseudomonadota bacterium]
MARLDGKIALITGGASGFGAASGKIFAREGAKVVLTDKNADGAQAVAQEIGNSASAMSHDVVSEDDWKRVVADTLDMHGKLDILMNNAGVMGTGAPQDIENMSLDEWKFVQEINSDGVFLGCRAVIQAMKDSGGGSIINISSTAGFRATPGIAAYGASKGAVRQLTKSVAAYCGRKGYNIRCNSIHPGMVRTPLGEAVLKYYGELEERAQKRAESVPLGTLGEVEDVAYAALYLASDEARYINSSELIVDGGMLGGG